MKEVDRRSLVTWFARIAVGLVFAWNMSCAIPYLLHPEAYAWGYEVGGVPGKMIVKGFGILFLMWNVTYLPVLVNPHVHKTLFAVILVQQVVGLAGESWLALTLPPGHTALLQTGKRFILFDAGGLILMGVAFLLMVWQRGKTGH